MEGEPDGEYFPLTHLHEKIHEKHNEILKNSENEITDIPLYVYTKKQKSS